MLPCLNSTSLAYFIHLSHVSGLWLCLSLFLCSKSCWYDWIWLLAWSFRLEQCDYGNSSIRLDWLYLEVVIGNVSWCYFIFDILFIYWLIVMYPFLYSYTLINSDRENINVTYFNYRLACNWKLLTIVMVTWKSCSHIYKISSWRTVKNRVLKVDQS